MDEEMRDLFESMMNELPDEIKEHLKKVAYAKGDSIVGNPQIRKETRTRLMASGDKDAIEGFEHACDLYDTNLPVVQLLSNVKSMLSKFDEHDWSSYNIQSNVNLLRHIHLTMAVSMTNIGEHIKQLAGDDTNETGDGDTSG